MAFCIKCGNRLADNVKKCPNCGTAVPTQNLNFNNQQNTVPPQYNHYNAAPPYYNQPNQSGGGISPLGLIVLIIGICGLGFSIFKILNDMTGTWERYTYAPPFTDHEIGMIAILVISLIVSIFGACTVKRK